jgi:hypothetical protein
MQVPHVVDGEDEQCGIFVDTSSDFINKSLFCLESDLLGRPGHGNLSVSSGFRHFCAEIMLFTAPNVEKFNLLNKLKQH